MRCWMFIWTTLELPYTLIFHFISQLLFYIDLPDLQEYTITKKIALNFFRWFEIVSEYQYSHLSI